MQSPKARPGERRRHPRIQRCTSTKVFTARLPVAIERKSSGSSVRPAEGQNRNCVASAARLLCNKPWDAPLEDIREHRAGWEPVFGPETFSPEYSGWWAFSLKVLFGDRWWDAVGKVPRELVQSLEARMRTVEETVRGADEARWTRTDPEAEAAFELARHALHRMGVSGSELTGIVSGLRRDVYGPGRD